MKNLKYKISKHLFTILLTLVLVSVLILVTHRNKEKSVDTFEFTLKSPAKGIIKDYKKVKGRIVAAQIINVKPQISGSIETIYVSLGDSVSKGQAIAKLIIIPSIEEIKEAKQNFESTEITYLLDKSLYEKNISLYNSGGVSSSKLDEVNAKMEISKLNYESAINKLQMLIQNNVKGDDERDYTIINSTINGIILSLPNKEGESVNKLTSNNDGTIIAKIANLGTLVFESKINESDINRVHIGMSINLSIPSMSLSDIGATISEISPLSIDEAGIVKFNFSATIEPAGLEFSYSGISATAEILFSQTDSVLYIDEKYLQFDDNAKPYVELWVDGENLNRDIVLGISDGNNVEIKKGLGLDDKLLLPDWKE